MTDSTKKRKLVADSLAAGVVAMLVVTVLQRGIGFARNLLLCRYLDDAELGRWSLSFSFLILVAPLIVFGLPGAFGRYVEAYRRRGQLRLFVTRTGRVCGISTIIAALVALLARRQLSWLLFHDYEQQQIVVALALTLIVVTAANFVTELLMALRLGRLLSLLQFANSLTFAVVSLVGVIQWGMGATAVIVGYGAGSLIVLVGGTFALWFYGTEFFQETSLSPTDRFWRTLVPFAWWIWLTNLLTNLYDTVDRFMIVHLAPSGWSADALVGQYHAGRVVPLMLVAVSGMLCGITLPYLSADWEAGRLRELSRRINRLLQWSVLGFTIVGIGVLVTSHWLFDWLLRGKYDQGLAILPWTLAYSIWFGLMLLVQNYLWCAERAGKAAVALVVGLAVNVVCNAWWVPAWGVQGAVLATSLAIVVGLCGTCWLCAREGLEWEPGSLWVWALPAALLAGPWVALAITVVAAWCLQRRGGFREVGAAGHLSAAAPGGEVH